MKKSTRFSRNLLKSATDFHGHLGPYLVLGLRMGLLANKTLQPRRLHDMSVLVWTKRTPPESCLLDGIQVSSGCTLGKTNLRVKNAARIRARFRKGNRSLLIQPTEKTTELLRSTYRRTSKKAVEELAIALSSMSEEAMFSVKRTMRN